MRGISFSKAPTIIIIVLLVIVVAQFSAAVVAQSRLDYCPADLGNEFVTFTLVDEVQKPTGRLVCRYDVSPIPPGWNAPN